MLAFRKRHLQLSRHLSCYANKQMIVGWMTCREQQFELQARYSADSPIPESFDQDIGRFMLGPPKPASTGDKVKLKVICLLSLSIDWDKFVQAGYHDAFLSPFGM